MRLSMIEIILFYGSFMTIFICLRDINLINLMSAARKDLDSVIESLKKGEKIPENQVMKVCDMAK